MQYLKFLPISLLFITIISGCGEKEPEDSTAVKPGSFQDLTGDQPGGAPSVGVGQEVAPIKLSPEDQEKAKLAPEGMAFIKGGCFTMGNNFAQEDEYPEHEVCVDDFYLDKMEVTQERWEKLIGYNPSKHIGKDLPVEQVNYYDAKKFVEKSGGACRLPTEAEWEYAVRGGIESRYYWGNMMNGEYAWYEDNSEGTAHPVGQKKPNQYGLHDMMGNVWEWTDDWYHEIYDGEEKQNPKGPANGEFKVVRGGAFDSSGGALRATNRTWLHPKNRVYPKITSYGQIINEIYNFVGFRCAKSITPKTPPTKN